MARRWLLLLLAAGLVIAACGGEPAAEPTEPAAPPAPAATTAPPADAGATEPTGATTEAGTPASGETTVAVITSDLGDILADGEGRTLYAFLNDAQGESTCYDQCAQNWPALSGPATAGEGVDDALLGTVERDDGSVQATYNDWPLYHYAADAAPGDTNGQGVGDVWYVVGAGGEPVEDAEANAGTG